MRRLAGLTTTILVLTMPAGAGARPVGIHNHPPTRVERLEHLVHRLARQNQRQAHFIRLLLNRTQPSPSSPQPTAAATASTAGRANPPTGGGGTFPAQCVANAEEGGSNSTAGYFGFIYPPSAYGASGPSSWLDWSWSAQLAVAESLFARYGDSAWGPLTRAKCW